MNNPPAPFMLQSVHAIASAMIMTLLASCTGREASLQTEGSSFDAFLSRYNAALPAGGRRDMVDAFWLEAMQKGIPLVDPEHNEVVFLYRDDTAMTVELTGDMTGWNTRRPFTKLDGSDLYYLRGTFPANARFDYRFVIDGERSILDPGNAATVQSGYGTNSGLAMPGFAHAPELAARADVPKGTLTTHVHSSGILEYDHVMHVYLPAGYDSTHAAYPVVYFQDGDDYIHLGSAPTTLDNLIAESSIQPVIAVFVVPPSQPGRNRTTEYSLNEKYAQFLASELVAFVDSAYRTIPKPHQRLIIGESRGGLISLFTAFLHPDIFANAASQSGYVSFNDNRLVSLFRESPMKDLRVYADVGLYEETVTLSSGGVADFLRGNRLLRDVMIRKGYACEYREFPDGHSWGRWRTALPDILRIFFGLRR